MIWFFGASGLQLCLGIQTNRMTNPPFFNSRSVCGCWWVVTDYFYGGCEGGISRMFIKKVINPTHPTKDLLVVVGGLSRIIFMASVRGAYQGCLLRR
jgi:hypothetical protein